MGRFALVQVSDVSDVRTQRSAPAGWGWVAGWGAVIGAEPRQQTPQTPGRLMSCTATQMRTENGLRGEQGEEEEEEEDEDLDEREDAAQLERRMRDRRRAKSLPAYPALLLDGAPEGEGRKRVTFADSLGLNLASVKHFSSLEEPQIPTKVLSRHRSFPPQQLEPLHGLAGHARFRPSLDTDRLVRCFPEPRDTEQRLRRLRVCLEGVHITQFDVRGHIRALEGGHREVGVRYTFNDWLSHVDAQALPVPAQEDADAAWERFGFTVYTPPVMDPSSAVHFAVYLRTSEGDFWDNNEGQNYTLRYRCLPDDGAFVSAAFDAT